MVLACGAICRPTLIEREIRGLKSNTSPFHVFTDAGPGFVKAPNGPRGTSAVIAELVSAELGTWLGLKIPAFSIIPECNIELVMKNGEAMTGPLFFSQEVDGTPYDGTDTFLSKLHDPDDVARLVIFDTWVHNWDRCGLGDVNLENLLVVRRAGGRAYDLVPIDHAWAFDGEFPSRPPTDDVIEDATVYGNFPAFESYIDFRSVTRVLDRLSRLDRRFVEEVVNSVPPQCGLANLAASSLTELICRRAAFVVNTIADRLVDNPPLTGMFGHNA